MNELCLLNWPAVLSFQFNLLLKGFCDDAGVSVDEAIKAFDTMCKQDEGLKDFFEVISIFNSQ